MGCRGGEGHRTKDTVEEIGVIRYCEVLVCEDTDFKFDSAFNRESMKRSQYGRKMHSFSVSVLPLQHF